MRYFPLPTRVSRLYPVFALTFLLSSSILFYAWQSTQLELESLSTLYASRQSILTDRVKSLTADEQRNKAKLQVQKQQLDLNASKLATLQSEIDQKAKALADSEQQLHSAQAQLANQQDQLSKNADELKQLRNRPPLFSFANTTNLSDIAGQESDMKSLVTDAYPYIQAIYGQAYLLHQVTITFVNSFTIAGSDGEIVIENGPKGITMNIHVKSFHRSNPQDVETIIHELIHAQHGIAVVTTSALEEGMTVAATDAVTERMIADGKLPHYTNLYLTISDSDYQRLNKILSIPADNTLFYQSPQISEIYQVIGLAWMKLYHENQSAFEKINEAYYPTVEKGGVADSATVLAAVRQVVPSVRGEPIDQFLSENRAFNPQ